MRRGIGGGRSRPGGTVGCVRDGGEFGGGGGYGLEGETGGKEVAC